MALEKRELTPDEIDDIKYIFDYVDEDKDGLITFDEFKRIILETEIDIDWDTLYHLAEVVNPNKEEHMTLDMVIHFFQIRPLDKDEE